MAITKIVMTGGPCAGKSSAMAAIKTAFGAKGYTVLIVPETATELITGGVSPSSCGSNAVYQKCQMILQLEKERVFEKAAETMHSEEILIVCDRGAMDNKAYMEKAEFEEVLATLGESEESLCARYDAIFHLVTAAKGAEAFYSNANNAARTETAAEGAALDDKVLLAWSGHRQHVVIDNSTDFTGKIARLIAAISDFLAQEKQKGKGSETNAR